MWLNKRYKSKGSGSHHRDRSTVTLPQITIMSLLGIPLIQPDDDLARVIIASLNTAEIVLQETDVLVITSKIVSKSEGRRLDLRTVTPSARAQEVAAKTGKDPRLVEVALSESQDISRMAPMY